MRKIAKFIFKIILLVLLVFLKEGYFDTFRLPEIFYTPIIKSFLHFIIFWLSLNIAIRFAQFIYRKRKKEGDRYSDNVIIGLQNIYYLMYALGVVIMIVGFFGIEFGKLLTAVSIVAAAIAIISKEYITDILCGMNFSFSKEIAIGDYVRIGDQKGRVEDINLHKIELHNEDDDIIYIPNSKAYYTDIVNYTQKEIRKYNLYFSLHQDRMISLDTLKIWIDEVVKEYVDILEANSYSLKVVDISKEQVTYKFRFRLKAVNIFVADDIKSRIREHIIDKVIRR